LARPLVFAIPGTLETATGGYVYDRRVIEGLRARGHAVSVLPLGEGFPFPDAKTLASAGLALTQALTDRLADPVLLVDGLALGVLPDAARQAASLGTLAALIHHPLALETGLPEAVARQFRESETEALRHADRIVTTSATTAALLSRDYGVPPEQITIARPGVDPVVLPVRAPRSASGSISLLSVGAISPRKGFDLLIGALGGLIHLDWRLTIVGDESRSPETTAALRRQIAALRLEERVLLAGAIPNQALADFYAAADLFVLASRYEGYGMAFQEALAHGLPIIGTSAGAVPEVVPSTAGRLVPPGDAASLRAALSELMLDPVALSGLAAGARAAAATLPRWSDTVDSIEPLLDD